MDTALETYLSLLLEVNAHTNLTAIREPEEIRVRHFEDSLALLKAADFRDKSLLDVGSGAGFPGLVLKIAEPSLSLTILEANGKKLAFLEKLCQALSLSGVCLLQGRAELLAHDPALREGFDLVSARAVADMETLCELCLPFVILGGLFLAMKERRESCTKLSALGGTEEESYVYQLSDGREHLVQRIRKTAPCAKQYPRPWAKIQRERERLHRV